MKPAVTKHRTGYQLSYNLPHQIYDSHVYPRKSSNGSIVVVYGHDAGLRVVWYAGRKFKAPKPQPAQVNGHSNKNEPVNLDDDDDEPAPMMAAFEEEDDEVDAFAPYHSILRHIDIPLGLPALRIAVPSLPEELSEDAPSILQDNIVIGVGCADLTVRAVVIPLQPPPPEVDDVSKWGIQITKHYGHQDLISATAITYTPEESEEDEREESASSNKWSILLASTSTTGSGLLLVHQVSVAGSKLSTSPADNRIIRRVNLRSPLDSANLSFNTASPEAERHTQLLVTIPDASSVKVYQVFSSRTSRRRGSAGTIDSISTTRSTSSGSAGRFLVTLLPGFCSEEGKTDQRKRVLNAKWISSGRAILALLEDGQYGIWDLEAAGPPTETVIKNQTNAVGITGGAVTKFAASGVVDRKREASDDNNESVSFPTGFVSVRTVDNNDSVIISTNGAERYIPSAASWWKSKTTGKGSLQPRDRLTTLPSVLSGSEPVTSIDILPPFANERKSTALDSPPNFIVATSSRLVFYVNPLSDSEDSEATEHGIPIIQTRPESADQSLLERGNLDLEGVDRYLEDMQRSRPQSRQTAQQQPRFAPTARPNFGSSMMSHGFGDDGDMDVDSPDVSKFSLAPRSNAAMGGRRVFS